MNTNCANWTDQAQLECFYSTPAGGPRRRLPEPVPRRPPTAPTASPGATGRRSRRWSWRTAFALDTSYYYWPPDWIQDRPGMFTGSGMPMRFADLNGSMIDVYQAATQMTDESGQSEPANIDSLLNKAVGPEGYYGVFTANMHTDSASSSGSDAIVASALSHGVPVVSARQMLDLARRPQPILVQRGLLEREQAELQRHPRRRRERPAGDGADHLLGWSADHREAGRRPDPHHHPDDQGRRVRVLRRDRRQLRGDLRRRRHRAGDLQRRRLGYGRRHRHHHLGHQRGIQTPGSTTAPAPAR